MRVKNFMYNGFSGKMTGGYASYTAEFKRWTEDPGIAVCACSDGKERLIPSFALDDFRESDYPAQDNTGKELFVGRPCCS